MFAFNQMSMHQYVCSLISKVAAVMTDHKRLRGWALEKEMLESKSSVSSGSQAQSALATKLLSLWSHGLLAATTIRELAHLSILDGASHPELATLAKAGNFGEQSGNVIRDIIAAFCKQIDICDSTAVEVSAKDPKSNQEEPVEAGCFFASSHVFIIVEQLW